MSDSLSRPVAVTEGLKRRNAVTMFVTFAALVSVAGAAPLVVESLFASARSSPWWLWLLSGSFVFPYFVVLGFGRTSPKWSARLGTVTGCLVLLGALPLAAALGLLGAWAYRPTQYLCLALAIPVNALLVQRSLARRQ
jgi:hypothetical protein